MMDIRLIAFTLLVGRVVSMAFIVSVLKRQWLLLRLPITPRLRQMRKVLFLLSLVIFLGNLAPIAIDVLTLFVDTSRPSRISPLSVAYALSSNIPALLSSILIWLLYKMAEYVLKEER